MNKSILFAVVFCAVTIISVPVGTARAETDGPHAQGTNFSIDGTIWYHAPGGCRSAYTSPAAFLSYGFNSWGKVILASLGDTALPICVESGLVPWLSYGKFIPPQVGKIVCSDRGSDKGTCYLMNFNQKRGFTSEAIFKGLGYSFSNIMTGDVSWMETGPVIGATDLPHGFGILINDNGAIKMAGSNGVVGFPNLATFYSWGFDLKDVVPANEADRQIMQGKDISTVQTRTTAALHPLRY